MVIDGKASLSIKSVTRTAAAVTTILGIEPTATAELGDPVGRIRTGADGKPSMRERTHSIWVLDSPETLSTEESDFSSVHSLIEILQPKKKQLEQLHEHYFIEIAWNGYSDRMQAGFLIPADLLAAMGALGVDFHGQVYFRQTGGSAADAATAVDDGSGETEPSSPEPDLAATPPAPKEEAEPGSETPASQ
ncbi:MAG: DUF4279 domain-containing protein [Rhodoglobus sp.]